MKKSRGDEKKGWRKGMTYGLDISEWREMIIAGTF